MGLEKLYKASFRGIKFYIPSGSESAGRKTIMHEYPNSDRRFIEDQGLNKSVFTINIIVAGSDYLTKTKKLKDALNNKSPGILVYPFIGSLKVKVVGTFTVDNDIRELGKTKFTVTFAKYDSNIYPVIGGTNNAQILKSAEDVLDKTSENISNKFNLVGRSISNFNEAKDKVNNIIDKVENVTRVIDKIASKINDLSAGILAFRNDINSIITSPQSLASSLTGLFNNISAVANNPIDQFNIMKAFFNFGDDDVEILQTTQNRIERKENKDILNNAMKINSLALAYLSMLDIEFNTIDDIDFYREELDNQYNSILGFDIETSNLDSDVRDTLIDLREQNSIFFENKILTTARIETVKTKVLPMTILAYQFYGDIENTETLITLNQSKDVSFIEGDINILTYPEG